MNKIVYVEYSTYVQQVKISVRHFSGISPLVAPGGKLDILFDGGNLGNDLPG